MPFRTSFEDLAEHIDDLLCIVEEDGKVTYASPSFQRVLGYSAEEIEGRGYDEFVHPAERAETAAAFERAVRQLGSRPAVTHRLAARDGRWLWFESRGRFVRDGSGRASGLILSRDVTDRVEAERQVEEARSRLESLLDALPVVLWSLDTDLVFTLSEGKGLAALGLRSGEVVGRTLSSVYPDQPELMRDARKALAGQQVTVTRTVGGRVFDIIYAPIRSAGGAVVGAMGAALDVTARRSLQDQLREAQKMEAIGLLTGGVAHDFNNLLSVITANLALAASEVSEEDGTVHRILTEIEDATHAATAIASKLLAFSRGGELKPKVIDLVTELAAVAAMIDRLLPDSVNVIWETPEERLVVRADPTALDQIALNVATNARDAMPQGGTLSISVRSAELTDQDPELTERMVPGRYAVLEFDDSGDGISDEILERIFEPFFTTKPEGMGTGLGLPMVRGLAEQHGGGVHVASEPGRGTRVRVLLPALGVGAEIDRTGPAALASQLAGGSETVLVVDDAPAVRRALTRVLLRYGYGVVDVGNGREAAEVLAERGGTIDLVISDLSMPEMDGEQLVHWMSANGLGSIPVLLTSGHPPPEGVRAGDREITILPKPWAIDDLLQQVRAAIERRVP